MSCAAGTGVYLPQRVEDKDTSADAAIALVSQEAIPTWGHVDITQVEVEEVSGCGGSKTFRVSISDADTVPATIAFHSRSELNKPLLEERNIAAGRAFANAGVGPVILAEAEDLQWSINEWAGEAIVEKYTGPGCQSEATGVAALEKMTGQLREHIGRVLGRIHDHGGFELSFLNTQPTECG